MCNNWKKNASHMYAEVINLLTTYKKVAYKQTIVVGSFPVNRLHQ
ncbi:MAG: hypothetical protein ACLRPW_06970 [Intestinibacter sp.]